jgi:hypothetical protein
VIVAIISGGVMGLSMGAAKSAGGVMGKMIEGGAEHRGGQHGDRMVWYRYAGVILIGSGTSSHVSFGSLQRISPALRSWLGLGIIGPSRLMYFGSLVW